jgi:hypothetical protein
MGERKAITKLISMDAKIIFQKSSTFIKNISFSVIKIYENTV